MIAAHIIWGVVVLLVAIIAAATVWAWLSLVGRARARA
jgi:hypothetical protein